MESRPARIATRSVAGGGKTKEQLTEDLRKTREELAVQKWGIEKTLGGMKVLVKELIQQGKVAGEAKAKDEAILSSIGDGMIATDQNARVIFMNEAAEKLIGWKREEVIGKLWFEVVPMEDDKGNTIPDDKRPIIQAIFHGKSTTTTTTTTTTTSIYYFVRKDKTKFPVAVTATPIILNGKVIGAIGIYRDITHEKEIDKAKTEFVSLASHQLRTPLSTINWYTEMLLSGDAGEVNENQKKYLEEAYNASKRMVELVNSLLNVSRLEMGTFVVEPELTDVMALAKSVADELKLLADQKKISLKLSCVDNLPKIQADPKLLRMVLSNLLSNSVKYTPEKGEVKMDLSVVKGNGKVGNKQIPADSLLCTVADTGYGIPKSQQDKIFTKLFRADNVREKDAEGTGLGLYIVKSIIDHSNGMIWFESVENKPASPKTASRGGGTTFYVILPLEGMKKKEGTKALA